MVDIIAIVQVLNSKNKNYEWFKRRSPIQLPLFPTPEGEIIRFVVANSEHRFRTQFRLSLQANSPIVGYVLIPCGDLKPEDFDSQFWRKLKDSVYCS